jgi:hypothetical protein
MSNPTSSFGWQMPTASDLVTDLPADFEVFGQAVDTSLADLKGGTTGQVLSKATNADMDFTWVTTDDANAIQNSIVDAKGDLIAASANDTPARLAVGNNGETLVADSSTSTGLRYQGSMAAGKNALINGGFDIWQRGTTVATATSSSTGFAADRWQIYRAGFATGATLTRQATGDTTNLPFIQYCARVQRDSGNTSTASYNFSQNLESSMSIPYAGKTFVLSFYARAGANYSVASSTLRAIVKNGTGIDQNGTTGAGYTGSNQPIYQNVTLTTTWQRFSITATMPTNATEFLVNFEADPVGTAGANDYFEVTGVQVEVGSVPTQFTRAGGTIQGELAACRRYLPAITSISGDANEYIGYAYGTNATVYTIPFDVPARVKPTGVTVNNSGSINAFAFNTPTSVVPTFNTAGIFSGSIIAAPSITAGQGSRLQIQNTSSILFTGCEL